MNELDGLGYLTENSIKDDYVTPIRACGAKWIEHLVEAVQNIGIYLTDFENFGKKEKKAKVTTEFWQNSADDKFIDTYLRWDSFYNC